MRRCSYVLLFCALLGACERSSDLPPQEVLKRTARASQELTSARFFLVATPRWDSVSNGGALTFNIDGRLQDGGGQVQFLTSVQGDIRGVEGMTSITGAFELIVAGSEEVYLNIHSLESQPVSPAIESPGLIKLIGQWVRLSSPVPSSSSVSSIASDPKLLKMQSEVVDVVRDFGLSVSAGRSVYHYAVRLNPDKLLAFLQEVSRTREEVSDMTMFKTLLAFVNADGELFIDAETFLIERLIWHITAPDVPFGTFSLDLTLDLKDHGKAPPILPPVDVIPFPSNPSFPMDINVLSSGDLLPEMTPSLQDELINTLMDTGL